MSKGMSVFEKTWVGFVSLATICVGLFFAVAPVESLRQTPYAVEAGVALMVFGAVMFLALFIVRVKALLLFFLSGLVAAGCGGLAYTSGPQSWEFYVYGILAVLISFFSLSCLYSVFTGEDPAD